MAVRIVAPVHLRTRVVGAMVGAVLPALLVVLAALDLDRLVIPAISGIVGIPVGAVFGWWRAPRVRRAPASRDVLDQVLRTAVLAVPVGAIGLATALALGGVVGGQAVEPAMLAAILPFAIIGLIIFGLPALAFAVVVIGAWAVVVRRLTPVLAGDHP